jgi:hypothetical protein
MNKRTYDRIPLAAASYGGVLPSKALIASEPEVVSQGRQPSCTAFAVAYAARSILENERRNWGLDTKDHLFSPAFIYNQIHRGNCKSGTGFVEALNLVVERGISPLSTFPYDEGDCGKLPNDDQLQAATIYRIFEWRRVNTLSPNEIKAHIARNEPVMFGMDVDEAFERLTADAVYHQPMGANYGGHAMVVDGYDDSKGAFRIFNSWGPKWSDGGRGWIAYDTFTDRAEEAYVISEPGTNDPVQTESIVKVRTTLWRDIAKEQKSARTTVKTIADGKDLEASLSADAGTRLTNPRLKCIGKSCDHNDVVAIGLKDGGQRATAAWNPAGAAVQWELSAEQHSIKKAIDLLRQIPIGSEFSVVQEIGQPATEVSVSLAEGSSTTFEAGEVPKDKSIILTNTATTSTGTVYTYKISK